MPPVLVGSAVIGGSEAEAMINVLAHHRRQRYRAGDPLDWLYPTAVPPTPVPGMPPVVVNGVVVVGHEAEAMIDKFSRMRRHGHYRAGMPLDWLGFASAMPAMAPVARADAGDGRRALATAPMPAMVAVPAPVVVLAPARRRRPRRRSRNPGSAACCSASARRATLTRPRSAGA